MKNVILTLAVTTFLFPYQPLAQSSLLNEQPAITNERLSGETHRPLLSVSGSSLSEVLDHVFDSLTSASTINGFNAAMYLPDGTIWKRASGLATELPAQEPLTTDHLMGMGSITKSFVSVTLLLMYEEGLLDLDDSIGQYLDPYPNVPGHTTIRQLLSHRSGINDYLNENPAMSQAWLNHLDSLWEADTILTHYVLTPNFPVGADWSYSNTNYLLAGRIIENITGQPWYEIVRNRILNPYALGHTVAYPWESYASQPFSHVWGDLDGNGTVEDLQGLGLPDAGLFSLAGSAGCLLSTPEDLARFSHLVYGGYVLKDETLQEMITDYIQDGSGFEYGLGVSMYLLGIPLENHGHDGSLIYKSFALHFPSEEMSLAVQQNDDRLAVPGNSGAPFDLFYLSIALLETYLNYTVLDATADLRRPFENLTVSPNPAGEIARIDFTLTSGCHNQVSLHDLNGKAVLSKDFGFLNVGLHRIELNLGGIPAGMYVLALQNGNQRFQKILVIQ